MKRISCIIPAYNEAPRIGAVLSVVVNHPLIDEVIVIDDGSSDGTGDVVRTFPSVRLLVDTPNRGKSGAVARGMEEAQGEYLLMLDADLVGLTPAYISALAEPVLQGACEVTMSLRGNSLGMYKFLGMDFFSGERVFVKNYFIEHLREIALLPGYFLETYLNGIIVRKKLRVEVIDFSGVTQTTKAHKLGTVRGTFKELQMACVIGCRRTFFRDVVLQNYSLLKLRVGNASSGREMGHEHAYGVLPRIVKRFLPARTARE